MIKISHNFNDEKPASSEPKLQNIGAKNFMQSLMLNGFSINRKNDKNSKIWLFKNLNDNTVVDEYDPESDDIGGIILFPADFKADDSMVSNVINIVKNWTEKNFLVSLGNYIQGSYRTEEGVEFSKNSTGIEITGISWEILLNVLVEIAKTNHQNTLLVKNNFTKKIFESHHQ